MTKDFIRSRVWQTLRAQGVLRFPSLPGRTPNFVGSTRAAARLWQLPLWGKARRILLSNCSPQLMLRRRALAEGKIVFMLVPGLRYEKCFVEVNPRHLGRRLPLCTSLLGALKFGRLLSPSEMPTVDLIVWGSLAVRRDGARIGAGDGITDLVYAILREEGRVRDRTPIATLVHSLQIVHERVPMAAHDVAADFVVTPSEVTATHAPYPRPRGVYWDLLSPKQLESMPALRRRMRRSGANFPQTV